MEMYITNPSGKRQLLPCYWESGRQWKARYSPAETGRIQLLRAVEIAERLLAFEEPAFSRSRRRTTTASSPKRGVGR